MLTGYGEPMLLTRNLTPTTIAQELLFSPQLVGFNLETSVEAARKIRAWKNCKRVVVASAPGDEESTLTLRYEVDWAALQVGMGELAENVNVTLPTRKEAKIPLVTPFEISDTAITAGADVRVYLSGAVGTESLGHLTAAAAAPTGRQFQITAGKLVFPSTLAGGAIVYSVPSVLTSVPSIGKAPNPVKIDEYAWVGHACGDGWPNGVIIHIPRIKQVGKPSINTDDDEPVLEIQYECLTAAGERAPIHYYLRPAA